MILWIAEIRSHHRRNPGMIRFLRKYRQTISNNGFNHGFRVVRNGFCPSVLPPFQPLAQGHFPQRPRSSHAQAEPEETEEPKAEPKPAEPKAGPRKSFVSRDSRGRTKAHYFATRLSHLFRPTVKLGLLRAMKHVVVTDEWLIIMACFS